MSRLVLSLRGVKNVYKRYRSRQFMLIPIRHWWYEILVHIKPLINTRIAPCALNTWRDLPDQTCFAAIYNAITQICLVFLTPLWNSSSSNNRGVVVIMLLIEIFLWWKLSGFPYRLGGWKRVQGLCCYMHVWDQNSGERPNWRKLIRILRSFSRHKFFLSVTVSLEKELKFWLGEINHVFLNTMSI